MFKLGGFDEVVGYKLTAAHDKMNGLRHPIRKPHMSSIIQELAKSWEKDVKHSQDVGELADKLKGTVNQLTPKDTTLRQQLFGIIDEALQVPVDSPGSDGDTESEQSSGSGSRPISAQTESESVFTREDRSTGEIDTELLDRPTRQSHFAEKAEEVLTRIKLARTIFEFSAVNERKRVEAIEHFEAALALPQFMDALDLRDMLQALETIVEGASREQIRTAVVSGFSVLEDFVKDIDSSDEDEDGQRYLEQCAAIARRIDKSLSGGDV